METEYLIALTICFSAVLASFCFIVYFLSNKGRGAEVEAELIRVYSEAFKESISQMSERAKEHNQAITEAAKIQFGLYQRERAAYFEKFKISDYSDEELGVGTDVKSKGKPEAKTDAEGKDKPEAKVDAENKDKPEAKVDAENKDK